MKEWQNDKTLFALIRNELYAAVIGDIMDKMGCLHQFLSPRIRPVRNDMFVVGRAMTVLETDVLESYTGVGVATSWAGNPIVFAAVRHVGWRILGLGPMKTDFIWTKLYR